MDKILKEKYKTLAGLMNDKSLLHVPIIKQVLECFEIIVTEDEADFMIEVGASRLSDDELRAIYKEEEKGYDKFMYDIYNKGLMWISTDDDGVDRSELAAIFPGWLEVNLFTKELSPQKLQLMDKFCELLKLEETINMPIIRMYWNAHKQKKIDECAPPNMSIAANSNTVDRKNVKKISVNTPLESGTNQVLLTGEVTELLNRYGKENKIALVHCFCRQISKIKGDECMYHLPLEACLAVGDFAKQMVDYHIGRYISLEEALELVEECQKKGAIHTVFHYGTDTTKQEICICNCCIDCCCLLGSYNAGGISNVYVKAHAKSVIVNEDNCNSCNLCNHFCPTNATGVGEDGKLFMDVDKCIGCGQCVSKCRKDVRIMERGDRGVYIKSLSKSEIRVGKFAGMQTKGINNPGAIRGNVKKNNKKK